MKRFLIAAAAMLAATPVLAADVGVSVSVNQPGFYGTIDIGNTRPQVVYAEPVVVEPVVGVVEQPVYMRVPPGHAKRWARYCHSYHACGRPVYFVQEDWYQKVYVPEHRGRGHGDHDGGWRDHDEDRDHGHGHGHGHGHRD